MKVPIIVLRTCSEQSELSSTFDLVLLTRFAKKYNDNGNPNFTCMEIDKIDDRIFVIEDFIELFENKQDREELIFLRNSLPVKWYGNSQEYNKNINISLGEDIYSKNNNSSKKFKG